MSRPSQNYRAALYMRLSKEDGRAESGSIGSQRSILRSYAREQGFEICGEYVDDGWGGTSFERPAWKRLIADIEAKRVNLVLTKDLSRLGRDYITAGRYTELYFPSKGVRYIAVNDGYDSDSPCTDIAPFKNIVNEMYARDTSRKIRSALSAKMEEGAFIGNFAPYGYRKDPADKNRLLVDGEAAAVVRELFAMAADGRSPTQIASSLNQRGVPPPSAYRRRFESGPSPLAQWSPATVGKMLRNIVYLGHMAQGKTSKVSFKSRITLNRPRAEWVVVERTHEPLVSQELFDAARRRSSARRRSPRSGFVSLFSGLAVCADCGRAMSTAASRKKGSPYNLVCGGYKLHGRDCCSNHFMDYQLLCRIMQRELAQLLALTGDERQELLERWEASHIPKPTGGELRALKRRERELDAIIGKLYEDNARGLVDDGRFHRLLASWEAERRELLDRPAPEEPSLPSADFASLLEGVCGGTVLSPALLAKLVDKIEVFQGSYEEGGRKGRKCQTIRIHYRFCPPHRG